MQNPALKTLRNKTIIKATILSLLALSIIIPAEIYIRARQGLGPTGGHIDLPAIKARVLVRRDKLGIPYIEAQSMDGLFVATGYISAQDRLWQITMMKMAASGRLAELFGPKLIDVDIYMRSIGIARYARLAYQKLPAEEKRILKQYAIGFNYYLQHNKTPIEFVIAGFKPEAWKAEDCMIVFALANYQLSNNLREELGFLKVAARLGSEKAAQLYPIYPDEELPIKYAAKLNSVELKRLDKLASSLLQTQNQLVESLDPARKNYHDTIPASNNWAIAKERTQNGKSIVVNDTHLAISLPSFWAIMHLKAPGYEAAGVMIPGVPLIGLGYNGHIAWGATMMMADSQDIFIEKLQTRDGQRMYLYKGQWLAVKSITETIKVKDQTEAHRLQLEYTHHGPLLNQALAGKRLSRKLQPLGLKSDYGLAVRWSMADGERGVSGLLKLARARSIAQARQAISYIDSMYLNIVYGNAEHIAWQTTGQIPLRKNGRGLFPSPGWTGEYDWQGYLAFEKKPFVIDPKQGWIGTANHRTVPPDFTPSISASWYGPWRHNRIQELLRPTKKLAAKDMHRMHADRNSAFARRLIRLLKSAPLNQQTKTAINRLQPSEQSKATRSLEWLLGFDGNMLPESSRAALLGAFYYQFTQLTFLDEPVFKDNPEHYFDGQHAYPASLDHLIVDRDSSFYDSTTTPDYTESRADMIAAALAAAWELCQSEMGPDQEKWQWGQLHTYYWQHQLSASVSILSPFLDRGPFAAGGDATTLNVAGFKWGQGFQTSWIPAMRFVVDFSQADPAMLVSHTGQSGNPASAHYDDMIDYFLKVKNHPLPFLKQNIDQQYNKVFVLE